MANSRTVLQPRQPDETEVRPKPPLPPSPAPQLPARLPPFAVDAFFSIIKDEGVLGLWTGVGPTMGRATVNKALAGGWVGWGGMWLVGRDVVGGAATGWCVACASVRCALPRLSTTRRQATRTFGSLLIFTVSLCVAQALAAAELATYDEVKGQLKAKVGMTDGLPLTLCTAFASGYVSTVRPLHASHASYALHALHSTFHALPPSAR